METLYNVGEDVMLKATVEAIHIKGDMIRYDLVMPAVYSSHFCTAIEDQIEGTYEDPFLLFKEQMIEYLLMQPDTISRERLINVVRDWHRTERKVIFEKEEPQ